MTKPTKRIRAWPIVAATKSSDEGGAHMNVKPVDDPIEYLLLPRRTTEHAVIYTDPEGVIIAWHGAAENIFGYAADEVIGKTLAVIFSPEDQLKNLDKYELEVAISSGRSENDRWHQRRDGTRVWVTGTVSAIRDDVGELVGFVKIARDRTDLRSQVEFLKHHAAVLVESRDRTHRFISTLGHELRNPLGPLNHAVQAVQKLAADPVLDGAFQVISRQVGALSRLAEDLMDITRLETGKLELNLKHVDLRRVLGDAVAGLQKAATDRAIRLEAVLPEIELKVEIDEARFQRLLLNLLNNAIKYTPSGGSVWVKAAREGEEVVFRVEDTGIGIAPEVLPRIFELFTQEMRAAGMAPGGLGIGLTMVREIAELHGGSVQARSSGVGKGSEFTVRLPARRAADKPDRTETVPRPITQHTS
jgi:PAS domain S-box-containing protein